MSNTARPTGARPFGNPLRTGRYLAGGAVFPGDFVATNSAGFVVSVANDGSEVTGAVLGAAASYTSASGQELQVFDHPDQQFVTMASAADVDAQTDINLNYSITATAGDTTYKVSRHRLKSDSQATTATLPLKLLAIDRRPDNALGASVDCIVVINNHQLKGGTGTVGT